MLLKYPNFLIRLLEKIIDVLLEHAISRKRRIQYNEIAIEFFCPNRISRYRAETFKSKEPETLQWIDSMPDGSVFWDIGANIGLYSVYAALKSNAKVVSFEPSVFNLELLVRNININGLQNKIAIVPIALSNENGIKKFRMSNISWGGALSTFGETFDQNGENLNSIFEYSTVGLDLLTVCQSLSLDRPTHVKIDVDGLEHFILRGAGSLLSQPAEILIEVNDLFLEQADETSKLLSNAGLQLVSKFNLGVPHQFNQLWRRSL